MLSIGEGEFARRKWLPCRSNGCGVTLTSQCSNARIKNTGLREVVWVNFDMKRTESKAACRFSQLDAIAETGMISRWLLHANASVCSTHTGPMDSVLLKRCEGFCRSKEGEVCRSDIQSTTYEAKK
jgi:hypothetical protein